ncbi:gp168 [Bacillus phage W.Ph.]|uniref:Gp168 n=1 Tax=Bacillus phage W.Ph. TaxID=764595 RepID=G9B1R9_9CAUD|nr:gp168 [Bacillus phage W.Ph.]ADH03314.1 gp168 [Bacillus phage W.Ph.]
MSNKQFNLSWDQAKELLKKGYSVEHESFEGKSYLIYYSHSMLCTAFGHGYGEYEGEPAFHDTIASVEDVDSRVFSSGKVIKLGYEPSRYIKREGWRKHGLWTKKI